MFWVLVRVLGIQQRTKEGICSYEAGVPEKDRLTPCTSTQTRAYAVTGEGAARGRQAWCGALHAPQRIGLGSEKEAVAASEESSRERTRHFTLRPQARQSSEQTSDTP